MDMAGPAWRRRYVLASQTQGGVPVCQARGSWLWGSAGVAAPRGIPLAALPGRVGGGLPSGLGEGVQGWRGVDVLDSAAQPAVIRRGGGLVACCRPLLACRGPEGLFLGGGSCQGSLARPMPRSARPW